MATQDDYIRTALRVPPDLHAQIHEHAKSNNRTFNAEIVARLQASMAADEAVGQQAFEHGFEAAQLKEEVERLSKLLEKRTTVQPISKDYLSHLDEILARRDEKMRSWWEREFGYDPQTPPIDRTINKGPAPSSNARKSPPKKLIK